MRQQCTADTVAVISTALEQAPVVTAVRGARWPEQRPSLTWPGSRHRSGGARQRGSGAW
jgi:hypothetical protein